MRKVLIIDDNPGVGEALSLLLSLRDIRPLYAASPDEGLAMLAREPGIGLVIQDMNFTADTTSGECERRPATAKQCDGGRCLLPPSSRARTTAPARVEVVGFTCTGAIHQ